MLVFGAAALFVFLVLAANYESWKLPLSVVLIARRHRLRPDLHTGFPHSRAADRPSPRSSHDRSLPAREEPPRLGPCNGGGAFASGH